MTSGLERAQIATAFDLEDLATKAWEGEIRVPHFQRGFRWRQRDVLRLFDSIVKRYPIGSLLLWVRQASAEDLRLGNLTISAPEMANAYFVVDGQQRIISLANALHPDGSSKAPFALSYDLREQVFVARSPGEIGWQIPLPVLFDLQMLLNWFADRPDLRGFFDHATSVAKIVRQYEVPAYIVRQDDEKVLQDIFDRMNNYGQRLTRAEVFTALNAGDEASNDDSLSIELIAERINEDLGFGLLEGSTVLRAILARRGPDVEREIRLEFTEDRKGIVDFPSEGRDAAFKNGETALLRAVRFLQDEAGIPHVSMLPYQFLLIVLARFFGHYPEPDAWNRKLLRRWFWRTALAGPDLFKGSTTGTTRALAARIRPADLSGAVQQLLETVSGNIYTVPDLRRFRTNDGATKIVVASWWNAGPRSTETAEPFEQADLSATLGESRTAAKAVRNLFSRAALPKGMRTWAANRVLLPDPNDQLSANEIDVLLMTQPLNIADNAWQEVLRSHAIPIGVTGTVVDFLIARHDLLERNLTDFLERMCEWKFEDTPPLDDLVVDDDEDDDET